MFYRDCDGSIHTITSLRCVKPGQMLGGRKRDGGTDIRIMGYLADGSRFVIARYPETAEGLLDAQKHLLDLWQTLKAQAVYVYDRTEEEPIPAEENKE